MRRLSPSFWATCLIAFALVCVKKWEPGGNLDSIWYSAVSRNVALTGNYHHFFISPSFYPTVADHMPLTYWIEGFIMSILGISDFVARLYPMICSFLAYIFVYLIGCEIGLAGRSYAIGSTTQAETSRVIDQARHVGLSAVIAYLLAYGSSKWNGTLMLDVPLVMYFVGATYFFVRGLRTGSFWLAAPFLVLGIMTKGPIIGAIPLAIVLWTLWDGQWVLWKRRGFWIAMGAILLGLAFFCLPWFKIDETNPFIFFFVNKKGYLHKDDGGFLRYFAYVEVLWTNGAPLLLLFVYSARVLFTRKFAERSLLRLCFLIAVCTIVPLSFFQVKFPHYMLPAYPFMALTCSYQVSRWLARWSAKVPMVLSRIAIVAVFALAFLPVQTSGGRSKETLNIVNVLKMDPAVHQKRVTFLGKWDDDMAIFQSFKWWGDINLETVTADEASGLDLEKSYVLVSRDRLPMTIGGASRAVGDCFLLNAQYCVITGSHVHLELPVSKFPHQVYELQDMPK